MDQTADARICPDGLADSPRCVVPSEGSRASSDGRGRSISGLPLEWILTTLTIYWMTATATTSFKPYYAMRRTPPLLEEDRVEVPTGVAVFPHERVRMPSAPRSLAERHFNVTRWNEFPAGGPFQLPTRTSVLHANDLCAHSRDHFAGAMIVTVEAERSPTNPFHARASTHGGQATRFPRIEQARQSGLNREEFAEKELSAR